jgi:L-threonylcarbamoyladenylate synthase
VVRVPNHPVALALLEQLNFPLAAQANPFGSISPTKANMWLTILLTSSLTVLEGGECRSGIESTIIGFEDESAVLYRLGSITIEEIEAVIGSLKNKKNTQRRSAISSWNAFKHYAPKTTTVLTETISQALVLFDTKKKDC